MGFVSLYGYTYLPAGTLREAWLAYLVISTILQISDIKEGFGGKKIEKGEQEDLLDNQ